MDYINKNPDSDKSLNSHLSSLLSKSLDSMKSSGKDIEDIRHKNPNVSTGASAHRMTDNNLMTFTTIIEAMDKISDMVECGELSKDLCDEKICSDGDKDCDDSEILSELNDIFTPVLVMQGFEKDIANQANAELTEASVLTERNIINFDNDTRMAQLLSICALLIAKNKNSKQWQLFKKAAAIKRQTKLAIQKDEYDDAKKLANKYLIMLSTSNNSSVARNAADELLSKTN